MAPQDKKTSSKAEHPSTKNLPKDEEGNIIPGPGRPAGKQNKFTAAMQDHTGQALRMAGERIQLRIETAIQRRKKKEPTPEEAIMLLATPEAAYLLSQAEGNPNAFMGLAKQLMPAKIDIEMTMNSDALLSAVEERRRYLIENKSKMIDAVAREVEE